MSFFLCTMYVRASKVNTLNRFLTQVGNDLWTELDADAAKERCAQALKEENNQRALQLQQEKEAEKARVKAKEATATSIILSGHWQCQKCNLSFSMHERRCGKCKSWLGGSQSAANRLVIKKKTNKKKKKSTTKTKKKA